MKIAFSMAKMETLKILTQSARDAITEMYKDLDDWLSSQIEMNVQLLKAAAPVTLSSVICDTAKIIP
jgi:hypothetical protein